MASKRAAVPAKHLFNGFRAYEQPARQCHPPLTRSMATEAPLPSATLSQACSDANLASTPTQPILEDNLSNIPPPTTLPTPHQRTTHKPLRNPFLQTTSCTLYSFPAFRPTALAHYPSTHLLLPPRKDLLHRAVIYEADCSRAGTASTKHRSEVHGSGRKVRPQKGSGSARLGDKKSPMLRGGGVAFGPKPRDFSSELPRKVYDMAFRMALSWRYKMGELIVIDSTVDVQGVHEYSIERYVRDMLDWNGLGHAGGRALFVAEERREGLFRALDGERMGRHARALEVEWVDVKDLLEGPKLVVERAALEKIFTWHESDLPKSQRLAAWTGAGRGAEVDAEQALRVLN